MNNLENEIVGAYAINAGLFEKLPDLLEADVITSLYNKLIYREYKKAFNENLSIDLGIITDSLAGKVPATHITKILDTFPKSQATPRIVKEKIRRLKIERLKKKILAETNKQNNFLAKELDLDLSEIRKLQEELDNLNNREDVFEKELRPILISLDSVPPEPVQWLWHNRIPMGKLSLIVGDPGLGKSFLLIYLAAHITTGKPWPDIGAPIPKGSVIIMTAEDGIADTIRVRADAAGADVNKIKILEGIIKKGGNQEHFNVIEHLPALEEAIKEIKDVRAVEIDPITSYLGNIDGNKTISVRGALAPLATLAEKYKIPIIGVTHLNKDTALKAIYRTMGSISFVAAARAVWAVTQDEDDELKKRRLLIPLKTNLSIDSTSLAFRIIDTQVVFEELPIEVNIEEAFSKEKHEETSSLHQATQWLKEALEDGPIASKDIYRMAKENNISDATLRRAQEKLKIKPYKEGMSKAGKWFWRLSNE